MQSSPRRSLACMDFSVKSKWRQGCDNGTGPFWRALPSPVLLLVAIDAVLQRPSLVFEGDLSVAGLSDFHVGVAHGVGRALSFDLLDRQYTLRAPSERGHLTRWSRPGQPAERAALNVSLQLGVCEYSTSIKEFVLFFE